MEPQVLEPYEPEEPTRADVDQMPGPVLLNFGTNWCGYCRAVEPSLTKLLAAHPEIRHIKVEDGKGKPLGRSFGVRLWPTLVFLRDGKIARQVSRPDLAEIRVGLAAITRPGG